MTFLLHTAIFTHLIQESMKIPVNYMMNFCVFERMHPQKVTTTMRSCIMKIHYVKMPQGKIKRVTRNMKMCLHSPSLYTFLS